MAFKNAPEEPLVLSFSHLNKKHTEMCNLRAQSCFTKTRTMVCFRGDAFWRTLTCETAEKDGARPQGDVGATVASLLLLQNLLLKRNRAGS